MISNAELGIDTIKSVWVRSLKGSSDWKHCIAEKLGNALPYDRSPAFYDVFWVAIREISSRKKEWGRGGGGWGERE